MNKFLNITTKSLKEIGVPTYKALWEKAQKDGYSALSLSVKTTFKKGENGEKLYHATFSSPNQDRHGDIVMQVFDLKGFMNNPVYLDSHNYDSIEHIIGKIVGINTDGGALNGDVEFNLDNEKGVMAQNMVEKGFLNTSSIGFIPKVFDNEGNILESELLEISAVSVPANADAQFDKKDAEEVIETPEEKKTEEVIEPVVEAPAVEEPKAEEPTAPVESDTQKAIKVISSMTEKNQKLLSSLAKNVKELVEDGKKERSRRIYQIVRELSLNLDK